MADLTSLLKQFHDTVTGPEFQKGLNELAKATGQAAATASATSSEETVHELPVDSIRPSPFQARKDFDEQSIKDLAATLQSAGQIQPVIVRLSEQGYELVTGERRWRAAKVLGWQTIKAIVRVLTDTQAAVAGFLDNVKRQDLSAIERAKLYQILSEHPFSLTHQEIANSLGISDRSAVGRTIALLREPPEIRQLIQDGGLVETQVRYLSRIDDPARRVSVAQQAAKEGWSVRELEAHIAKHDGTPKAPKIAKPRAFDVRWSKEAASVRCRDFNFKTETVDEYLSEFSKLLRERVEAHEALSRRS